MDANEMVAEIDEPMRMWSISTRVNKPENDNDDPSILEPIEVATSAA